MGKYDYGTTIEQRIDQKLTDNTKTAVTVDVDLKQEHKTTTNINIASLMQKKLFTKQGIFCKQFDKEHPMPKIITITTASICGKTQEIEIIASDKEYAVMRIKGGESNDWILAKHGTTGKQAPGPQIIGVSSNIIPQAHIMVDKKFNDSKTMDSGIYLRALETMDQIISEHARVNFDPKNTDAGKLKRANLNQLTVSLDHFQSLSDWPINGRIVRLTNQFLQFTNQSTRNEIRKVALALRDELCYHQNIGMGAIVYDYIVSRSAEGSPDNHRTRLLALMFYAWADITMTSKTHRFLLAHAKKCAEKNLITQEVYNSKTSNTDAEINLKTIRFVEAHKEEETFDVNIFAVDEMPIHAQGITALSSM